MEIENKKKTKYFEWEDHAPQKKARGLLSETDPELRMREEEIAQSFVDWMDSCDDTFRRRGFGEFSVEEYIKVNSRSCAPFYEDHPSDIALLESDKALCEGICSNVHILHIIAEEWCRNSYPHSDKMLVFFYVIKHNLLRLDDQVRAARFVERLFELSYMYPRGSMLKYQTPKGEVKVRHSSFQSKHCMKELPSDMYASFAVFFYPNLQFLVKKENGVGYIAACSNIKQSYDAFLQILQSQLNPPVAPDHWSLKEATSKALDHALLNLHNHLKNPTTDVLEFNTKPLVLTSEVVAIVSF